MVLEISEVTRGYQPYQPGGLPSGIKYSLRCVKKLCYSNQQGNPWQRRRVSSVLCRNNFLFPLFKEQRTPWHNLSGRICCYCSIPLWATPRAGGYFLGLRSFFIFLCWLQCRARSVMFVSLVVESGEKQNWVVISDGKVSGGQKLPNEDGSLFPEDFKHMSHSKDGWRENFKIISHSTT